MCCLACCIDSAHTVIESNCHCTHCAERMKLRERQRYSHSGLQTITIWMDGRSVLWGQFDQFVFPAYCWHPLSLPLPLFLPSKNETDRSSHSSSDCSLPLHRAHCHVLSLHTLGISHWPLSVLSITNRSSPFSLSLLLFSCHSPLWCKMLHSIAL